MRSIASLLLKHKQVYALLSSVVEKQLTLVVSIYKENKIDMPKKKSWKSRAMEGVDGEPSQLEVQETRQEQDTQPATTPQYEDVTQESDL